MAAAPNASMGLLNSGGCGVLLPTSQPNSSSVGGGFLVPGRSLSVLPLRWGLARKRGRVLDSTSAGAVATGEAGSGSSELRHIEKELTFSPTFTDYVKVMESVKLDRSKNLQGGDSDGRSSRRRFTGHGDRRAVGRSGDARSKSFERKRGPQMDRVSARGRESNLGENESQKNVTGFVEKRAQGDAENSRRRQGEVEEYVQRRMVRGDMRRAGGNRQFIPQMKDNDTKGGMTVHQSVRGKQIQSGIHKDFQEREIETFAEVRTTAPPSSSILSKKAKSVTGREGFTSTSSMSDQKLYPRDTKFSGNEVNAVSNLKKPQQRVEKLGRNFVAGRFGVDDMDGKKPARSKQYGHLETMPRHSVRSSDGLKYDKPEIINMKRGENVKVGKLARRDANSADFDDRAAFKTFEVFTDVRNRPRILRMEMEERIQKLASRLNATDVNAPEWKFSKIIHDAKIKFSDHSILRIVQMLGRFGNWKRVLQVVEWLESRERFKSYKSRYIYTTVLDVLGKAKRPFEALNIFYTMQNQLSSYPDMAAYHCVAVTLGQAGLMKSLI
ncbi:hypothetical protein PR202_gb29852 [Eleusine coracana subsp. coracana]|uniref:Pentatricopeptide repeat-containing protein n=1 Tax=Eleusine coracana subsp. coracana TaxID=191504 RepID=A0AAV5G0B7_ELECO|nr:hypothetical protein PR202_gb29852 [Eleusine coracana subsp. coracana]